MSGLCDLGLYAVLAVVRAGGGDFGAGVCRQGRSGIGWLRPQALFGIEGMDPLLHAMFWSLALNTTAFALGRCFTFPTRWSGFRARPLSTSSTPRRRPSAWAGAHGQAEPEELLVMAQRILGDEAALALFEAAGARRRARPGFCPIRRPAFIGELERRLAGSVGAATAHAMISQLVGRAAVSVEDLMAVANETAQIMEYSARLEAQQDELTRTARQLREANEKLTQLSVQKDAFLSQISHELRTPMTSIRAFSEILMEGDLPPEMVANYGRHHP